MMRQNFMGMTEDEFEDFHEPITAPNEWSMKYGGR